MYLVYENLCFPLKKKILLIYTGSTEKPSPPKNIERIFRLATKKYGYWPSFISFDIDDKRRQAIFDEALILIHPAQRHYHL